MKQLTIIAIIPPHTRPSLLRKVWMLKSYLREEIGINTNIVVTSSDKGAARIIALGEIIDLREDMSSIISKITTTLAYDVSDPNFIDKVAIGGKEFH